MLNSLLKQYKCAICGSIKCSNQFPCHQIYLSPDAPHQCSHCCKKQKYGTNLAKMCGGCHREKNRQDFTDSQWYKINRNGGATESFCKTCCSPESERHKECLILWNQDRQALLELWKHGVATYDFDCNYHDCKLLRTDVATTAGLVGAFEIIYNQWKCVGSHPYLKEKVYMHLSRTVQGLLTLSSDTSKDYDYNDGFDDCRCLRLEIEVFNQIPNIIAPSKLSFSFGHPILTIYLTDEFLVVADQETKANSFDFGDLEMFCCSLKIGFIDHMKIFDLIPSIDFTSQSSYAIFLRQKIAQHEAKRQSRYGLLWLCQHKDIPVPVSQIIADYLNSPLPNITFETQENDLLLEFEYIDKKRSCVLFGRLVARKRG